MSTNYIDKITDTAGTTHDIAEGVDTRLFRATCSTAAGTAAKVATLDDATNYTLAAGVRVAVTFTYGNSAATPTLNVNSGGAKTIVTPTAVATLTSGNGTTYNTWGPYETVVFTYNGTYWVKGGTGYAIYNAYALANSKTANTGTVTSVTAGAGLSGGTISTSGTIAHSNSVTAQTTQALYPIKIDAQGHISAYGTAVTSLPASDVYSWAKASSKPTYTASEVGAATSGHTHTTSIATSTGTNQVTLAANTKYVLTAGGTTYIFTTPPDTNTTYTASTTSIGSASAGTAISADDITAWTTNTPTAVTKKTVVTSASGATAAVSNGVLTLTNGSFGTGDSVTVTAGTAASLSYTSRSIPNISVTSTTVATGITAN